MYTYVCTSYSGSECSCCAGMALSVRRSAVLFKSVSHSGIFVVENGKLNTPGGQVEADESFEHAAVRHVKDVVGVWPSNVSDDLRHVVQADVGLTRYFLVDVPERSWKACFNNVSDVFGNRQQLEVANNAAVQMHHIGVICSGHAKAQLEVLHLFVTLRQRGLLPGVACDAVDKLTSKLEPLSVPASAVAAPAASPAAAASDTALIGTSTMATNFPGASPVEPPGNAGGSLMEALEDSRQLASGSGRRVREASADAGGQPAPNAAATAFSSRRNDAYFDCRLCNTPYKQLRICWECNTWACGKCSFWCTLCPKNRQKYNICGRCHATGRYLWKKQANIWCCRDCW